MRYNQSVRLDPLTADVVSHVPRHTRDGILFRESTKIENSFLGLSVWREEDDSSCFFRWMMNYESPFELAALVDVIATQNKSVDAADMIQVLLWATPDGVLTEEQREKLTTDMRALCAGVPIITMHTEHLDLEQFAVKMEEAGDCYRSQSGLKNGRRKRAAGRPQAVCGTCKRQRQRRSVDEEGEQDFATRSSSKGGVEQSMKDLVHLVIGHSELGCM